MGSEEVLSVRAGLHPRVKRRGLDRVSLRQSSRNFNGGSIGNGSLGVVQGRTEGQRNAPNRGRIQHKKNTSHGGIEPRNTHSSRQHQRSVSGVVDSVAGVNTPASRVGGWSGSSIGTGGLYSSGDGSVGHAVHTAAVESVEVFLGDFVPKVATPPVVATLLSAAADEKGAGGGQTSAGGAAATKMSKWAAIGRGGKISARATAVCIEEVSVTAASIFGWLVLQKNRHHLGGIGGM